MSMSRNEHGISESEHARQLMDVATMGAASTCACWATRLRCCGSRLQSVRVRFNIEAAVGCTGPSSR